MDTTSDTSVRAILAGLCASLVGIGLARFAYTPLIPALIEARWFAPDDVVFLGAANLLGYLAGALAGRPLAARMGARRTLQVMMLAASLAFFACAVPLSVAWFFGWRFLSGLAGGAIMVLAALTILPQVPEGHWLRYGYEAEAPVPELVQHFEGLAKGMRAVGIDPAVGGVVIE